MNISEVKSLVQGASYENKIIILEEIFERCGDCQENGYLGSSVDNISYDETQHLEFQSEHYQEGITTKSTGAVLDDSVIIMQEQNFDNNRYNLYSWKLDGTCYTYLGFGSRDALERAYQAIKSQNQGFLAVELEKELGQLGISYRDITSINVAVRTKKQQAEEIEILDFDCMQASTIS